MAGASRRRIDPRREATRVALIEAAESLIAEAGVEGTSTRQIGAAIGSHNTNVVAYHFGSKEALLAELLSFLASTYAGALDAALAGERVRTRAEAVSRILTHARSPAMRPFMALWWEIVAGAARGVPGFAPAAEAMMGDLLGWLEGQMPEGDPDPRGGARYLLTVIEGTLMLGAIGHDRTAQDGLLAGGLAPS